MTGEQRQYVAYLLRLGQVTGDGKLVWQASLEDPHTRQRLGFKNLEQLFTLLEEQTGGAPGGAEPDGRTAEGGEHRERSG